MIYVLKFIYSFVLPPGIFIILLLALAFRLRKRERPAARVLLGISLLIYILSTPWIGGLLMRPLEQQYTQPTSLHGDVIVVLGGGATRGTPDLDGDGNLSGSAEGRLLTAARLYRSTGLPVLFSGGAVFSDSGNEAEISRRQLLALGVPGDHILIENRSLNTAQNAKYTAAILKERDYSAPILITSAFHLPRGVLEFEMAGVDVQPYPTDYWVSQPQTLYVAKISPTSSGLSMTGTALKEYLGLLVAKVRSL